ncbi:GGDEF domain-containing protein [Sulfurimonas sp.]|uniref:GGDEF domain-containing protein n=2 Tax=unclassified Sulfurimonas TaxID=2623549 RepID=UPI001BB8E577|nr:GGDEF domain-containing protein [Sulfurimonas sp.]MBS4068371.1 diguanylate cyclase [Sulfurimonas sp.]MDD3855189.1 GGDEF domain-containing protein [Sulfurimonas sp.]
MKFPSIGEIATTSVVSIDIDRTIAEAMKMMFNNEHRNLIVREGNNFRILRVGDILNIKIQNIDLQKSLRELDLAVVKTAHKDKNILQIVDYLNCEIEYICVVNDDGSFYGLVAHADIASSIDPDTLMDNFCLQDFLKLSRRAKWVNKNTKTMDLLQEMIKNDFESVIVIENFKPIGIFTTKDVVRVMKHNEDLELNIGSYMSSPVDTISKDCSMKDALEFLKLKRYKRVVVVDEDGKMSGIITQKELISLSYSRWAMLIKEHHEELSQLNASLLYKNKKYEVMASTDALTGLYNRHKFSELYNSSYLTMEQRGNVMSLMILDIDYFKKINDTFGHGIGDGVLIQISHALLKNLRNIDIICRWGGEEFVVLLPAVDLNQATFLAEKLRESIEIFEIDMVGRVTASFGVTQVNRGDALEAVVERADKALYEAKASGRNCVRANF